MLQKLSTQDPSQVLLFIDVVKEGSLAAAARVHNITRSTASRKLKQLEDSLGVQLLHRNNHHNRLTEAGEIYFQHAQMIYDMLRQAELAVHELKQSPSGRLRVAIPLLSTQKVLMPALWGFSDLYPDIQLEIIHDSDFGDDFVSKRIDVAFQLDMVQNPLFKMRKLVDAQIILAASRQYIEENGEPKDVDDLQHHTLIGRIVHNEQIEPWHLKQGGYISMDKADLATNSPDFLIESIIAGRGMAALPAVLVGEELKRGELIHLLPDQIGWNHPISLVHADTHIVQPKVRAFIDYIAKFTQLLYGI